MLKKILYLSLIAALFSSCAQQSNETAKEEGWEQPDATVEAVSKATKNYNLVIADFDSGEKPNNLGGDFGAWDKDPNDFTQTAVDSFIATIKHGKEGYSIQIYYDIDSPNPAFNGFWMKLNNIDASKYSTLNFWVKGDEMRGFTKAFKIELKNAKGETGKYYVSNLTSEWQKISIALNNFQGLNDLSNLSEFIMVFEDTTATKKEGAIYLDDIYLN